LRKYVYIYCTISIVAKYVCICEINIADAIAESSEKADLLPSANIVAHGKTISSGRVGDLQIPKRRGQCQEVMATAAMIGFVDGIRPSE